MKHPSSADIAYMKAHAHEDRRPVFIGVNVTFTIVAFVALLLRFWSRSKIGTKLGADDWLISSAVICLAAHASCLLVTVRHGMGRHAIFVDDPRTLAIVNLSGTAFYNLCITFVKLSIICLYGRIFRRTNGWLTPTLWISGLFVVLCAIPQCFVYIFQCVPVESLWKQLAPGTKIVCINFQAVVVAFGVINILTDFYLLFLPIPVILGLQLDKRTKWSVCSLFMIGSFVCIISIVRLVYSKHVDLVDPSWDMVPITMISTLECSLAIVAACMPTFRPLFRFLTHDLTAYLSGRKSGADSNINNGGTKESGRGRWPNSRNREHVRLPSRDIDGVARAIEKEHDVSSARKSWTPVVPEKTSLDIRRSGDNAEKMLVTIGFAEHDYEMATSPRPVSHTTHTATAVPVRRGTLVKKSTTLSICTSETVREITLPATPKSSYTPNGSNDR